MKAKAIYKFHLDYGRSGDLNGVFVAKKRDVERMYGSHVYFGEVLGKHSEVSATIDEENTVMVTDDPKVVALFEEHDLSTGTNPLDYYDEE